MAVSASRPEEPVSMLAGTAGLSMDIPYKTPQINTMQSIKIVICECLLSDETFITSQTEKKYYTVPWVYLPLPLSMAIKQKNVQPHSVTVIF